MRTSHHSGLLQMKPPAFFVHDKGSLVPSLHIISCLSLLPLPLVPSPVPLLDIFSETDNATDLHNLLRDLYYGWPDPGRRSTLWHVSAPRFLYPDLPNLVSGHTCCMECVLRIKECVYHCTQSKVPILGIKAKFFVEDPPLWRVTSISYADSL